MKYLAFLFLLFSVNAYAIRDIGNGAGGATIDGQTMTFYSAKIPLIPTALNTAQVPGLNFLTKKIQSMALPPSTKHYLMSLVFPVTPRLYFKIDEKSVNPQEMQKLINKYAEMMELPSSDVVIFAGTDKKARRTALLPAFFQLQKDSERAALLIHEGLWMVPNTYYETVVQTEMAAQAYFENGDEDAEAYYGFYNTLARTLNIVVHTIVSDVDAKRITVYAAVQRDLQKGFLTSAGLQPGQIYLRDLLGADFIHCLRSSTPRAACESDAAMEFFRRSQVQPQFLLMRTFADYISSGLTHFDLEGFSAGSSPSAADLENAYVDFNKPNGGESEKYLLYKKGTVIGAFVP